MVPGRPSGPQPQRMGGRRALESPTIGVGTVSDNSHLAPVLQTNGHVQPDVVPAVLEFSMDSGSSVLNTILLLVHVQPPIVSDC
jgi:hypothetical protein